LVKAKQWQAIVAVLAVVVGIELYLLLSDDPPPEPAAESGETIASYTHIGRGENVPAFEAEDFAGGRERIEFSAEGGKTFLFILSPTCGSCRDTLPHWNRLAGEMEGRARIYGLIMGSYQRGKELHDEGSLGFPALRFTKQEVVQSYKVRRVPQTILVAPGGHVIEAVVGELSEAQVEDFLRLAGTDVTESSP